VRWRGPLASRNFRLLVGCDVTSMTGSAVSTVAIPFAVLRVGGSASDIGFVTAAGLVPTVVFLLFGGVLADRLPRQQVMVVANAAQAATQAAFAVLLLTGEAQVWQMLLLTAARGCASGFYLPAAQGLLPQTVAQRDLAAANAIRRLELNGAQIVGAALGGVVVGAVGPGWGLVADAASYAGAALLRSGMRFSSLPPMARAGLLPELRAGWQAFTSRRWLWVVVVEFGIVNAIYAGAFTVIGPVVAAQHLGGASSWGLIVAAQSVGAAAGAGLMVRYRPSRLLLAGNLAVAAMALPLAALAVPLALPLLAVAAFLAGFGAEAFEVNWSTALQEQISLELLSRVSSYDALGSYALAPAGTTIAGPIAAALGVAAALGAGAAVIVVAVLAAVCVPEVRRLQRRAEPEDDPKVAISSAALC
jgi:MFS family permease